MMSKVILKTPAASIMVEGDPDFVSTVLDRVESLFIETVNVEQKLDVNFDLPAELRHSPDIDDTALDYAPPVDEPVALEDAPDVDMDVISPGNWKPDAVTGLPPDCPVTPLGVDGDKFYLTSACGKLLITSAPNFTDTKIRDIFDGDTSYLRYNWPNVNSRVDFSRVRNDLINGCILVSSDTQATDVDDTALHDAPDCLEEQAPITDQAVEKLVKDKYPNIDIHDDDLRDDQEVDYFPQYGGGDAVRVVWENPYGLEFCGPDGSLTDKSGELLGILRSFAAPNGDSPPMVNQSLPWLAKQIADGAPGSAVHNRLKALENKGYIKKKEGGIWVL